MKKIRSDSDSRLNQRFETSIWIQDWINLVLDSDSDWGCKIFCSVPEQLGVPFKCFGGFARLQLLLAHWTKLCSRQSWNWLGFWGIWKLYKSATSWRTYHHDISWNEILNWQLNMNISQNIFKNTQWFGKTRQGTLWFGESREFMV